MDAEKKLQKKQYWINGVSWGIFVIPFLISAAFYNKLPDPMVTHWNMNWEPNGYSPRWLGAWGIPLFMLIVHGVLRLALRMDPKRQNIERSVEMKNISIWFMGIFAICIQCALVLPAAGISFSREAAVRVPITLLFFIIGNYLPKCKQNYSMGIKVPWTLADEDNWNKTHRFAGRLWMIGAIVMALDLFFNTTWIFFGILIIMVLLPTIYSYLLFQKKEGKV